MKQYGGSEITITNPAHFPDPCIVTEFLEPMVVGTIITPGRSCSRVTVVVHRYSTQELNCERGPSRWQGTL